MVYLALKTLLGLLTHNLVPASVAIAHGHLTGVSFVRDGPWVIPQYTTTGQSAWPVWMPVLT